MSPGGQSLGNPKHRSKKGILIFVNPTSGTKLAFSMVQNILLPLLNKQHISYEIISTKYAGHAESLVKNDPNLHKYSGICVVSGDGLIFEVCNGLYSRSDKDETFMKIPLGIVPGGSGNALNCSLLRQLDQPLDGLKGLGPDWSAGNVANGIAKNKSVPLDLIEIDLHNGRKLVSFLGVSIGLISDVDIGSEHLRFLGYMRAYLYVAYRIIFPKAYTIRVSYLPARIGDDGKPIGVKDSDPPLVMPQLTESVPEDWVTECCRYYCVYAMNLTLLDPITLFAPDAKLDDGLIWLVKIVEGMSRWEMISWLLNTVNAGHIGKTGVEIIPVRAFRFEPIEPIGYLGIDAESFPFGPVQGQVLGQKAKLLAS